MISLLLLSTIASADELTQGPWVVQYDSGGVRSVFYDGEQLLSQFTATLYNADWQGAQFVLSDATVERDGNAITFTQATPDVADLTALLEVEGDTLSWRIRVMMAAAGPLECHIPLPTAAFESPAGDVFLRFDNTDREVVAGRSWPHAFPRERVVLRTGDHDITMRLQPGEGSWTFQDAYSAARLIGMRRSTGEGVTVADLGVDITIDRGTPEEARARRLLLSQRRATQTDVPIPDAGFEDGLGTWARGPNASLVTDDPAEGDSCARIDMDGSDQESVYITRQVPVTPGARYRLTGKIRSEDVVADEQLRMASVGACLIHEWADPDGKWIFAGDYSDSTWGTTGWHDVACEELLAPEGVGFATVFLALRGRGSAWFDDIKLTEVKRHVVLASPLDGAEIADNRPTLSWRAEPTVPVFTIECMRGDETETWTTPETSFRPPTRLAPGEYIWRVTGDSTEASVDWRFAQTAPVDADTTGPDITISPVAFTDGAPFISIAAEDESPIAWQGISLALDGETARHRTRQDGGWQIRPRNGWPLGASLVEVTLADEHGNATSAETWVVNTPAPPRSFEWTYDRGVFDGERHFLPLAMYQVPIAEMGTVREAGFNTVHVYQWEGSQNDAGARDYLDACAEHGLQAFIGFDRGKSSGSGLIQGDIANVARRIGALRDHPALLAWYLFDEPDLAHQYVPPGRLRDLYQLIKTLDPHHPVIVTFAMDTAAAQYPEAYDVHWTQVYQSTDRVRGRITKHREALDGRDIMAILTCYDRRQTGILKAGGEVVEAEFSPSPAKARADIAMALALRSSGLAWWWYGDGRRSFLTAADIPAAWESLSQAVAEVREIEPLLTDHGEELAAELTLEPADANVVARVRRAGDRAIIIVVSAEEERSVTYSLVAEDLPSPATSRLRSGDTKASMADGRIAGELGPLGRDIYEVTW